VRISIITAVFNREKTISAAIESVLGQGYPDIEYIVVDGNSDDGTEACVRRYESQLGLYIRESDLGIYNAMNKGLRAASGEIIGFLHADDLLASPKVIESIAAQFDDHSVQAVYGDLVYVRPENPNEIVRYWKSGRFKSQRFRWGWMPPHPTVYIRRQRYLDLGLYREDFNISADYELLIRLLYKHQLPTRYIDEVLVKMRLGGKSNASMHNRWLANREDRLAWQVNELTPPFGLQIMKPLRKIRQFWHRPRKLLPLC
jgi:glycosyltransferase involved in cell wall biosynthesis